MKNIYIILTQSGTIISKAIQFFTHDTYNHASICLEEDFQKFYSFGRLRKNIVLPGGFLIENAFTHVFGKFQYIPCMILKKEVTDEQFQAIQENINVFVANPKRFKYDYFNLFFAKTPITFPHHDRFFCSGFVAYILQESGIPIPNRIEKIRPYEFTSIENAEILYQGELKSWCKSLETAK